MFRFSKPISQETDIFTAHKILLENKLSGLPVIDSAGHAIGYISEKTVFCMLQD